MRERDWERDRERELKFIVQNETQRYANLSLDPTKSRGMSVGTPSPKIWWPWSFWRPWALLFSVPLLKYKCYSTQRPSFNKNFTNIRTKNHFASKIPPTLGCQQYGVSGGPVGHGAHAPIFGKEHWVGPKRMSFWLNQQCCFSTIFGEKFLYCEWKIEISMHTCWKVLLNCSEAKRQDETWAPGHWTLTKSHLWSNWKLKKKNLKERIQWIKSQEHKLWKSQAHRFQLSESR